MGMKSKDGRSWFKSLFGGVWRMFYHTHRTFFIPAIINGFFACLIARNPPMPGPTMREDLRTGYVIASLVGKR
jgi:hypothetical protein